MAWFRSVLVLWLCAAGLIAQDIFQLQKYGLYTLVLNSELLKCPLSKTLNLDVSLIKLWQYQSPYSIKNTYYLNESAEALLNDPTFEPLYDVLVYVYGFDDGMGTSNQKDVLENCQFLSNTNVLFIDHNAYTGVDNILNFFKCYDRAVMHYYDIGRAIARFLVKLIAGGVPRKNIKLMGHSLGGQIIGACGEEYTKLTGDLLECLIGVDPAGPCFDDRDKVFHIRKGLACCTQTWHCNAGQLGTDKNYTDSSVYMNGGQAQPGCYEPVIPEVILSGLASNCSHNACPKMSTLPFRYSGIWQVTACNSEGNYKSGACYSNTTCTVSATDMCNCAKFNGIYYSNNTGYSILS